MGGTVPVNISRYWQSTCTQLERHFFFGPYKILALGHMPSNPRTCSSSSGVKSFLILNVLRISSGVLPAIHKSILRKLDSVISSCPYSIFLHLAELFHDGFRTKQQYFSLSSALAHRFFPGLKSRETIQTAHWRTMASFTTPFFSSRVRMRTDHLATKWNYYANLLN